MRLIARLLLLGISEALVACSLLAVTAEAADLDAAETLTVQDDGTSLAGTVRDTAGRPLEDFHVYAWRYELVDGAWTWTRPGMDVTDASGTYAVGGLPAGTYRLQYVRFPAEYGSHWYPAAPYLESAADVTSPATDLDVTLLRLGGISGTMTETNGSGVDTELAIFQLEPDTNSWQRTFSHIGGGTPDETTGEYAFGLLRPGVYRLCSLHYATGEHSWCCPSADTIEAADDIVVGEAYTRLDEIVRDRHYNYRPPTVDGRPEVGWSLSITAGTWGLDCATTYRWYTDGAAIPGATDVTYEPVDADVGKRLTVRESKHCSWGSQYAESAATEPVKPEATTPQPTTGFPWPTWFIWPTQSPSPSPTPTPTAASEPTLSPAPTSTPGPTPVVEPLVAEVAPAMRGAPTVGTTLRVTRGSWSADEVTRRIQWFANGKVIKKATRTKLLLTKALHGKRISARVVTSATGYVPVTLVVKAKGKVT